MIHTSVSFTLPCTGVFTYTLIYIITDVLAVPLFHDPISLTHCQFDALPICQFGALVLPD